MVLNTIISDSYYEIQTDQLKCVAVADGVGGNAGGEYASRYVLNRLKEISIKNITEEYLEQFIGEINIELLDCASTVSGKENMATTLTGLVMTSNSGYIFHIGNTRIYGLQGQYLKQLTEDQTTYQWLHNIGQMEAAEKCNRNEITYCLGGGNRKYGSAVYIKENKTLNAYKRLLITTDGIHEYISIDELEDFLAGEVSEQKLRLMADKAKINGSADDKTLIVIDRM